MPDKTAMTVTQRETFIAIVFCGQVRMAAIDEKEGGAAEPFKIVKERVAVMLNDIGVLRIGDEMLTDNVAGGDQVWIRKFGVFISAWEQIDGMDPAIGQLVRHAQAGRSVVGADLEDGLGIFGDEDG